MPIRLGEVLSFSVLWHSPKIVWKKADFFHENIGTLLSAVLEKSL
jgi:hypothetical protein